MFSLIFNIPHVAMPPISKRENTRHEALRTAWQGEFPSAIIDPEVDREEWFEQANRWDAVRRSAVDFEPIIGPMPSPDPALRVIGVYTQNSFDHESIYEGYAWPDAVSARAATNWWAEQAFQPYLGRRFIVGHVPGERIPTGHPASITAQMANLARESDLDAMVKIIARSKYMSVERMVIPQNTSESGVQNLLWNTLGYAMEHLGDTPNGIQISDWIPMRKEYRIAMIDYAPVAGAGCIEKLDPCFSLDPNQAFDPQVESIRGDAILLVDQKSVVRYRAAAKAIGQSLRANRSPLRNFVLDLAQTPDGTVVVVECNTMLNFGQYAMSFEPILDAILQHT